MGIEGRRVVGVDGAGTVSGSGYVIAEDLVVTSAHVVGRPHAEVTLFFPGRPETYRGTAVWVGEPGRTDAALVRITSPNWVPMTGRPPLWGRTVTHAGDLRCEAWGLPAIAQRDGRPAETAHPVGRLQPGDGFVADRYVMRLDGTPPEHAKGSPWSGLSGAAMFCGDLLAGVVMSDPRGWRHSRLEVVPAYLLLADPAFRAVLTSSAGAAPVTLEPIEWQEFAREHDPVSTMPVVPSPASLLVAGREVVPFRGRVELLESLVRWAEPDGFSAWLVHGPGGQGKTRLAHELERRLTARWEVVWLSPRASEAQLRSLADAAVPVLIVVDYAENRVDQLAELIRQLARHPAGTPLKLLLLARTDQSWWEALLDSSSTATTLLDGTPRTALEPLESTPDGQQAGYESAVTSMSAALPQVRDLEDQPWPAIAAGLTRDNRRLRGITTVLGLHMTALADLLDAAIPVARATAVLDPEDRMLTHERRYWMNAAAERGVRDDVGDEALLDAMTAGVLLGPVEVGQADGILARVPELAKQPREIRAAVRRWMAALHPPLARLSWGLPQPDRIAERFAGRRVARGPDLVRALLSAPLAKAQAAHLLTVYTRAAAHTVFGNELDTPLTELCVEHPDELAVMAVDVAPQVEAPGPLLKALMRISKDPATPDRLVALLADEVPPSSHVLADWAWHNATVLADTRRACVAHYDGGDAGLRAAFATSLNILAIRAGALGRRAEALTAAREAVELQRHLAADDPDTYAQGLGVCLNDLAVRLTDTGDHARAVEALREAVTVFTRRPGRTTRETAGATHNLATVLITLGRFDEALAHASDALAIYRTLDDRPGTAMCLNTVAVAAVQHGRLTDAITAAEESVALYGELVDESPDLHRVDHAKSLSTLSNLYAALQAPDRAVAAAHDAVETVRPLTETRPLAVSLVLAGSLIGYALRLAETGRNDEALTANDEAVDLLRGLAEERPLAYGAQLATALSNRSGRHADLGRLHPALADSGEAVALWRTLLDDLADAAAPGMADSLTNHALWLNAAERRDEALTTAHEALTLFEVLAETNPTRFEPRLTMARRIHQVIRDGG